MTRLSTSMTLIGAIAALLLLTSCELNDTESPPTGPVAPDPAREAQPEPTPPPADPPPQSEPEGEAGPVTDPAPAPESFGAEGSDEAITAQIRQTLATDDWLSAEARQIEVSTEEGVVTLRGQVESEDERYIVTDIAWEAEGVRDVIDEIEVRDDGT